jgi:hypothetical protein
MKKLAKQVFMMSATLSMGISVCTMLVNADKADSTRPTPESSTSAQTDANVNLTLGKDNTVELAQVPTLNFEGLEMKAEGLNEVAVTELPNPIKVKNPGLEGGWVVTANIGSFVRHDRKTKTIDLNTWGNGNGKPEPVKEELKGATVTLYQGTISGNDISKKPTAPEKVTLSQSDSPVLQAHPKAGLGQSSHAYGKDHVRISIPEGNRLGAYTAKITWTMNMVPNS